MPRLEWDKTGEHFFETGVDRGVLYPLSITNGTKKYGPGAAWNGLTAVNESPSGAEATALWADNTKYLNLYSAEDFGCTIEAYTYPDEFAECNGERSLVPGVTITQQSRKMFGFSYRTKIGNDLLGDELGYKIHLIYGAMASPSEKSNSTQNESPEAATMSWTVSTTAEVVEGFKPTAHIVIDSRNFTTEALKTKLAKLESALYGTETDDAYLPLPAELKTMLAAG